jgi:hypothetical protein
VRKLDCPTTRRNSTLPNRPLTNTWHDDDENLNARGAKRFHYIISLVNNLKMDPKDKKIADLQRQLAGQQVAFNNRPKQGYSRPLVQQGGYDEEKYCFRDGDNNDSGTYSHRICPTNIKDEELSKKGRDDDPWPDAFPALVRQLPLVEKKKKMRANVADNGDGRWMGNFFRDISFDEMSDDGGGGGTYKYFDDDVNGVGSYSHLVCPTKEGREDKLWPGTSPAFALAGLPPFVGKKKKMRADQGLRRVEKRKKKRNNQIEPPFPADLKLCVEMSTLHSNDNDGQKAGSRGRGKPEAVEREFKKKKKTGMHCSQKRPYSL